MCLHPGLTGVRAPRAPSHQMLGAHRPPVTPATWHGEATSPCLQRGPRSCHSARHRAPTKPCIWSTRLPARRCNMCQASSGAGVPGSWSGQALQRGHWPGGCAGWGPASPPRAARLGSGGPALVGFRARGEGRGSLLRPWLLEQLPAVSCQPEGRTHTGISREGHAGAGGAGTATVGGAAGGSRRLLPGPPHLSEAWQRGDPVPLGPGPGGPVLLGWGTSVG